METDSFPEYPGVVDFKWETGHLKSITPGLVSTTTLRSLPKELTTNHGTKDGYGLRRLARIVTLS